jgi:hypothetical protein
VAEHAEYVSQCWYSLSSAGGSGQVLKTALAKALKMAEDEVMVDLGFCTCNWENLLSSDFGGTLWSATDGSRLLTIESGEVGRMLSAVQVRRVECSEPSYALQCCSSTAQIGCTQCRFLVEELPRWPDWKKLTRCGTDGVVLKGLYCPHCGGPLVAEVWID